MKNAPTGKTNKSAKDALSKRPDYTPLQIAIKASPWLFLQALAGLALTLSAGGPL